MSELTLLRTGDRQFIQTLYIDCFKGVSNWVRKNSGSEKEAEDVFQDALTAVYQKAEDKNFTLSCKLSTFIFGVAKNIWRDRLRRKGRNVFADNQTMENFSKADESCLDQVLAEAEIDLVYRRSFEKLSDKCQKLLTFFFNGLSMSEIVVKMDLPNDTVARKRKFNCKNELVALVEADPHYLELVEN